jgi:hypothetical protein
MHRATAHAGFMPMLVFFTVKALYDPSLKPSIFGQNISNP